MEVNSPPDSEEMRWGKRHLRELQGNLDFQNLFLPWFSPVMHGSMLSHSEAVLSHRTEMTNTLAYLKLREGQLTERQKTGVLWTKQEKLLIN